MRELRQQFYMLILSYREECGYPSQSTFVPNNSFFSMQGGQYHQPTLSYAQQLLSYNNKYPNVQTEVAQNVHSSAYPEYPLLNGHNAYNPYNPLPYGGWVIEQAQQGFPPSIMNSYPVNASYTMDTPYQPDHARTENPQNSTKEGEGPTNLHIVKTNRGAKKRNDPLCNPKLVYGDNPETRAPWGSKTWAGGQHLFSYTTRGQWLRDRVFNNEQLREYVDNCKDGTVFRVQQFPAQCKHRLEEEDCMCRWANCPVPKNRITAGWLRVCFDEFNKETTGATRDPLLCAGSMHLWCFEQVFDPLEFHLKGRLQPEDRTFLREETNVASLKKLTDGDIVKGAYDKWFQDQERSFNQHGKFLVQRKYEDTLSYRLNEYHLNHQSDARRTSRETRHVNKTNKEQPAKTIDVHMGNLERYLDLKEREKNNYTAPQPPDSPDTSRKKILPPPARRAKKAGGLERMVSYLPSDPAPGTSSAHSSQTQQRSLRGSDLARRRKKQLQRYAPPVDRSHNLSTPTWSSALMGSLNTNFTPSSSLNTVHSKPLSTLRPSLKILVPPNHNQGSLANVCPSNHPQAMLESSFSMEDPKQPGHPLEPPSRQYQQQQYSSTATHPSVKAEHQPVFQGCNLETPLEVSRGNDSVEYWQNETKTWTQEAAEKASQVLGGSQGTSLDHSSPFKGLDPEEASVYQFLILDEEDPESTQYLVGSTGAIDNTTAQTQMNVAACQSLEPVACTKSPQVAESWHSVGFLDPTSFGGFSNTTDILPLFDDSIATAQGANHKSRNG